MRRLIILALLLFSCSAVAATIHRGVAPVSNQTPAQTIASVTIDGSTSATFIPNGSTAVACGNFIVTMSPAAPAFSGVITIGGADAASFQTNPLNGTYPAACQAKAATAAGTYHVTATATPGGNIAPVTSGTLTITGTAANVIASLGLINDAAASTQLAGQPTQFFGQIFRDGDICGGSAPIFLDGATPQPFSASPQNARVYWDSGCLRFSAFMLRPTADMAGGGKKTLSISTGGTWPTASARTTSDIYNQHLVINAPPAPVSDAHVTGTLSSWLTNDVNNYRQIVWLDGDAGKCWRFDTKMAATQGGAADAALEFGHYACALNKADGTISGFRWLGDFRQPSFNFASAPATYRVFASPNSSNPSAGVNWQAAGPGGIGTTISAITWPFSPQGFTSNGSNNLTTTSSNSYYTGAGGASILPAYFTNLTGSTGLGTQLYFLYAYQGSSSTFQVAQQANGLGIIGSVGSGGGTVNPVVAVYPFTRVWTNNSDGKYNYFQGTGSIGGETSLRVTIDQTYWQKAKVFPPWDLSVSGSNPTILNPGGGGPITDISWNYPVHPYTIGNTTEDENSPGDHTDIGAVMGNHVVDFYNQSFLTDRLIRAGSYAAGRFAFDLKDASTHNTIDFINAGTYTGLRTKAAVSTDQFGNMCWGGVGVGAPPQYPGAAGFPAPADSTQANSMSVIQGFDHKPSFNVWAYARTGELQHLDMLQDEGQQGIWLECAYAPAGIQTYWEGLAGQFRQMGHQARDQQWAAMFTPFDPTNPTALTYEGTLTGRYFTDVADLSANFPNQQWLNGGGTFGATNWAYMQPRGLWTLHWGDFPDSNCPSAPSTPCYEIDGPEWEKAFVYDDLLIQHGRQIRGGQHRTG